VLRASIDLGTNTCLLLIADWDPARSEVSRVSSDHAEVVRLGQGVDRERKLHPDAMERTLACLRTYAGHVRAVGLEPASAVCVATSQARDARNGAEFFDRIARETGFRFRVISGDEEARLTFLGGLLPGMSADQSAIIDIGGGSTELISKSGGKSLDIGSVRFTERFLKSDPVTDEEFWACQDAIDAEVESLKGWRAGLAPSPSPSLALVGVAGTVTTLAQWHLDLERFDRAAIDGAILTRGDVHRMVEELKWRTNRERLELKGVTAGRADVLLAGSMILWRSMELLSFPEVRVSTRGLRYGALRL
jgi:exopolyphosphatase / guanosine-5'-triphosphate,3'-diphosphate pyrophosphatase